MNYSTTHAGWGLAVRLAWQATRRALARAGATRTLIVALLVAAAAVTAVTRLTDRVDAAVVAEASQTLGADLKLELDHAPTAAQRRILAAADVRQAETARLSTALAHGERLLRVSVEAVPPAYPLAGQIELRRGTNHALVRHGPPAGTIWVGAGVLARLRVAPGDRLAVGNRRFRIGAVLVAEPGGGGDLFDTAPRVIMPRAELAATGLAGPAARIHYAVSISGSAPALEDLRTRLTPTLGAGDRLVSPSDANRGLASAMDKATIFLNLAVLAAVVLAGVAVSLSAVRHAAAQRDEIALYKTLGAARGVLRGLLAGQLAMLGALGLAGGWLLGALAGQALGWIVGQLFAVSLPQGHWWAAWPAAGVVVVLLAGFAWPVQRRALATPPARVLARANDTGAVSRWPAYGLAIVAVALMAMAATGDIRLTAWVMAGLLCAALAFALITGGMLALAGVLRGRFDARLSLAARTGIDGVLRRRRTVLLQCVALGLGLTVIFVLVIVRGDLLAGWQTRVGAEAPNRFLINVTADQRQDISQTLVAGGVAAPRFYPIVRARLTAIDGQALAGHPAVTKRAGRLAERALNLSWAARLKADNTVTAGHWWRAGQPTATAGAPQPISIADTVARRLDIGVGATLTFDVAGQALSGRVASIRHIDWSSLQPNFFILFPPGALDHYPASWITSLYLPPGHEALLAHVVEAFRNINVIDIGALLQRVETLVSRVSLAVELVFGFTLAAGIIVLVAAMGVHHDTRRREAAVLRALGAPSGLLSRAAWYECALIGALAAVPAALAAQVAACLIASHALHVAYHARPDLWLLAILIATALIALAGVLALGDTHRQPAWRAIRETG